MVQNKKRSGAAVSTPDGKKEPRGGFVYDSAINHSQSRPRKEKVAKKQLKVKNKKTKSKD
jgi:hypothetical protein